MLTFTKPMSNRRLAGVFINQTATFAMSFAMAGSLVGNSPVTADCCIRTTVTQVSCDVWYECKCVLDGHEWEITIFVDSTFKSVGQHVASTLPGGQCPAGTTQVANGGTWCALGCDSGLSCHSAPRCDVANWECEVNNTLLGMVCETQTLNAFCATIAACNE